jgi:predicted ATP-dependent protease
MIKILSADQLRNTCSEDTLTPLMPDHKKPEHVIIGQKRAEKALQLGLGIKAEGFNVYVAGVQGTGKLSAVKSFLEEPAKMEPVPCDWCYVNNFNDAYQPKKLSLPAGTAAELKKDMKNLVQEALQSLIKAFESEEYANQRQIIADKFEQQQNALTAAIHEKATKESLLIKQTPWEIFTIPLANGEPMTDKEFNNLPEKERESIRNKQDSFADELKNVLQQTRKLEKDAGKEFTKLEKEVAVYAISTLIEEIEEKYKQLPDVTDYLQCVKDDILDNLAEFLLSHKNNLTGTSQKSDGFLKRYEVNVLIDNTKQQGVPVIIEHNPTYNNLIGRVEKESIMGTLVTDFTMIRKGSLHSANGGYLIIRAEELFKNFFSWEALKRAIRNKEIMIEEATDQLGYLTTKTLKPEPIPLNVKVILVGNPLYYYLLYAYDNDFKALFKVKADFDTEMDRTNENIANYILFANSLSEKENLVMADKGALAKLVEYGSRLAEDQYKLSTRVDEIADRIREAGYYAAQDKSMNISVQHIQKTIEEKVYRSNLVQEKINEMIQQKQILIDITGKKAGQVNGLSVINLGDITFGYPSRITSTINLGKSGIIAIEREAELSGPIHTKGVMILTGYLAEKFFQDKPVSLSARLVFEQSYAEVEGDSASSTELYAILSNLANLPVKQGIAVTGSVNQKGEVQAIGGVNEKIEGYFELCKLIGLTGEQGVMIPSSNVRNLMLKENVLEAVRENKFTIWAVDTIDDGIEILTGVRAGNIAEEGTVTYLVNNLLNENAEKLKEFVEEEEEEEETKPVSQ